MMTTYIAAILISACCCLATIYPSTDSSVAFFLDKHRERLMSISIRSAVYYFDGEGKLENYSGGADQREFQNERTRSNIPNLIILFLREATPVDIAAEKLRHLSIVGDIGQFTREIITFQNSMKDPSLQLSSGTSTAGVKYKDGAPVFVSVVVTKLPPSLEWKEHSIAFSISEARKYFADMKP